MINCFFRKLFLPFWRLREFIIPVRHRSLCRDESIKRALYWLCKAQDIHPGGGVSTGYDLRQGWLPDFPETTGYIVPTIFDGSKLFDNKDLKERALYMLNWLIEQQSPEGYISGIMEGAQHPLIFDTAQVLFGLIRGYQETKSEKYLEAAIKAGNWLVSVQDSDGKWSRFTFQNHIHTYNTRSAWALMELYSIKPDSRWKKSSLKNIEWALKQQADNGWFHNNYFSPDQPVYTHTIAYATRGILEVGYSLNRNDFIASARKAADALLKVMERNGKIAGSFDASWHPTTTSVCLTGNAQIAIVWLKLYEELKEDRYYHAAKQVIDHLIQIQEKGHFFSSINGAVKGSEPLTGNYLPYVYPNWAAKFFIDSMLLEKRIVNFKG
jgi:uncharacterized protein YyaL (SSP411 family)